MDTIEKHRTHLKKLIEEHTFIRAEKETIVTRKKQVMLTGWLFDLRRILMRTDAIEDICAIFWHTFKTRSPFQIAGIETAAIPLITALTIHTGREGGRTVSGFFIRKSRKKDGLMRMVEGEIAPGVPVILVDDLINSGKSFERQIEVLNSLGHHVSAVWTLIRFRDLEQYEYLRNKGIEIVSVFTLDDFNESLGIHNRERTLPTQRRLVDHILWKFSAKNPALSRVIPKSEPTIDDTRVYIGSDDGIMWALRQDTGEVAWSYRIGAYPRGKGIFSSPAVFGDTIFFGGYDGNFYALDRVTGKRKWVFLEADWIGSSPAVAPDRNLVFVGLEFGLWRKRGGVVALDTRTGRKVWDYTEMPCLTHSSPLYMEGTHEVVIGSNDGSAYLFNAQTGTLLWKFSAGEPPEEELNIGFSRNDIKESFAYDHRRELVIFGTIAGVLYFIDRKTGKEMGRFQAEYGFYSTPAVYERSVTIGSLDKKLYCVSLDTYQEIWRWDSEARIFASPKIIEGSVFIGSNSGRLTEINAHTGEELSHMTFTERITNKIAYNDVTRRFFVPTFANELYCVERKTITPPTETPP